MGAEAGLSHAEVLELIPQQVPFRFIEEITELSDVHAVGKYTFKQDEFFYKGHFPDQPITPGVILLETLCQTGLVALGIYLLSLEMPKDEVTAYRTLFTDAEVEFSDMVLPGHEVIVHAEKVVWRRRKLRSKVNMHRSDGTLVASGTVAGMGVAT